MSTTFCKWLLATTLMALAAVARAEDTDIYIGADQNADDNPNVMIVLDNSSNWSGTFANGSIDCKDDKTKFCNEVKALTGVIDALDSGINVGLAMFAETGTNGAYVRFSARPMTEPNKAQLKHILSGLTRNGTGTDSSGSNQPYGAAMFEMFKYFGGYTSPANASSNTPGSPTSATRYGPIAYAGGASNHAGTYRRDYAGNTRNDSAGTLTGNAFASATSNTYVSPITNACQKNFIIFISNGNPSTGGDSAMPTINTALGMGPTIIPPNHANTVDEWARYLKATDVSSKGGIQNVQTFTVAVYDPKNNCTISTSNNCASTSDNEMIKLMASTAAVGGGTAYTATDFSQLSNALKKIMINVQAVNSVFASASLPVSVNTQGTYLNQVFIGMFRPDGTGSPRWSGNLKQFEFKKVGTDVALVDSVQTLLINPATGFIDGCSQSYWTTASNAWSFLGQPLWGTCPGNFTYLGNTIPRTYSDSPDGEVVEKGAVAQLLRKRNIDGPGADFSDRNVQTLLPDDSSLRNFVRGDAGLKALLPASNISAEELIDWVRGRDVSTKDSNGNTVLGDENSNQVTEEMRPYVHGDVVHSRPLAIDFSPAGTPSAQSQVVVFYGDNLGVYRAVRGDKTNADGGKELWAFVPPECYAIPSRVYNKAPLVDFWDGAPPGGVAVAKKNYCMDGGTGVYKNGATTWIFPSMRRGGRSLYGFDVTNVNRPAAEGGTAVNLLWRKTQANFSRLGYTWSTPRVAFINGISDPMIIVGGGYDPCEDQDRIPNNLCAKDPIDQMGSTVLIMKAQTGELIKEFHPGFIAGDGSKPAAEMRSVVADIVLYDSDDDTDIDVAYALDIRGKLFRILFKNGGKDNWEIKQIADLGGGKRKFLYAPELVRVNANQTSAAYIGIAFGSGDREHPLSSDAAAQVVNRFYFIKDPGPGSLNGVIEDNEDAGVTDPTLTDLGQHGGTLVTNGTIGQYGWQVRLRVGEQVVTSPVIVGGQIYFSTNRAIPVEPDSCTTNLGEARGYSLNFLTGQGDSGVFVGGGLPPSPVVALVDLGGEDGSVLTCIGCYSDTNSSAIGATKPPINVPAIRRRVWWYETAD